MEMTAATKQLIAQAEQARSDYRAGKITRAECNYRIAPYAEHYNNRAREIAKEFGQKFRAFSITAYLR